MAMTMLGDEELMAVSGGSGKKKGRKRVEQSATVTVDQSEYVDLSGFSGTINGGLNITFGDDTANVTIEQSA